MKSSRWTLGALTLVALIVILIPEEACARRSKNPIAKRISADFQKLNRWDATKLMVSFHQLTDYVKGFSGPDAVIGFRQLKKDLYARSLQYTPQIIQLNAALFSSFSSSRYSSTKKDLFKIQKQIKPIVDIMNTKWGNAVAIGITYIYGPGLNLANRYPEDFKTVIFPVLKTAYNDTVKNTANILIFLRKVDNLELKSLGYLILGNLMSSNGHFDSPQVFQLAYEVKQVEEKSLAKLPMKAKVYLDKTKKLLPEITRNIVFNGKNCRVKNQHFGTYLYADSDVMDEQRRYEYLWWRPSERKYADRWNFTTTPRDKGKVWTIENEYYKDYLMANESSPHSNRRRTFLWRNETTVPADAQWTLSMVDGGKSLVMRNKLWNQEYAYADGEYLRDERRRNLFTWEGSDSERKKAKARRCQEERARNKNYKGAECKRDEEKEVEKPQGYKYSEPKEGYGKEDQADSSFNTNKATSKTTKGSERINKEIKSFVQAWLKEIKALNYQSSLI